MGTDIHGWIEIKQLAEYGWEPAVDLSVVLERNYEVFGLLFGVRNRTGLEPLAAGRGLPADVSRKVKAEADAWGADGHYHSFITLAELESAGWEQTGRVERVHQYGQNASGEWVFEMRLVGAGFLEDKERAALERGEPVETQGKRYQWDKVQAKHIRAGALDRLLAMMRLLAECCWPPEEGEESAQERVRLVVWFDE